MPACYARMYVLGSAFDELTDLKKQKQTVYTTWAQDDVSNSRTQAHSSPRRDLCWVFYFSSLVFL